MVKAIEGVSGDEVTLTSSLHSDDVFGVNTDSVKALSTREKGRFYDCFD